MIKGNEMCQQVWRSVELITVILEFIFHRILPRK